MKAPKNRICELRASRRMTQRAVAKEAEVSEKHLGRVEARKRTPGIGLVCRIARALRVPLCQLYDVVPCATHDPIHNPRRP